VDQGQFNDPDFISSTYQRKNVQITDNFSSIMVSSMKLTTSLCDIKGKMSGLPIIIKSYVSFHANPICPKPGTSKT
jgi:hypothetical protein